MKYITHRRFKGKTLCGYVNIPAMTPLENVDGLIIYQGRPICYDTSEHAHQHFTRNDDGNGMLRGQLTQAIQKTLSKRDSRYQKRWNRIWDDEICWLYKRTEYENHWLWSHGFFNANIDVLRHIAGLVGVKGGI